MYHTNLSYRARGIISLIIAILTLIGISITAVYSYKASVYQARHPIDPPITSGETHTMQFPAAQGIKSATISLRSYAGDVTYSLRQTEGRSKIRYLVQHKKANESSWLFCPEVTITQNNVFTRQFWLREVTYGTIYNACVSKVNYLTSASTIDFDWCLSSLVPIE